MRLLLAAFLCAAAAAATGAGSPHAAAPACSLPASSPLWIDYTDATVPFWKEVFAQPGLVLATPGTGGLPAQLRAAGAATAYFDLTFKSRVGTTDVPADPATIVNTANELYDVAVRSTGCSTPAIAENELFGASLTTPWSPQNAQYRANVLAFLRQLAARGAHPYLLVPSPPYGGGEAADWWRQVAQVADVVREFYPNVKGVAAAGPIVGSRILRVQMRQAIAAFTALGVPASRLGLMLEFESGAGGRNGLEPAAAWFEVVKLEALAARQVAGELGLASVWSWGWATYRPVPADADKHAAACVYLWARSQSLCDGPEAAGPGFDSSLTEGQLDLPGDAFCTLGAVPALAMSTRARLTALTGDAEVAGSALLALAASRQAVTVTARQVDTAENVVVGERFRGSRAAYLAALARAKATRSLARTVLADELRARQIESQLQVAEPTSAAVAAYRAAYGSTRARLVAAATPVDWLAGQTSGVALETTAPRGVFALPTGRDGIVTTSQGTVVVRPLGPSLPLAVFPATLVRRAIVSALLGLGREQAYRSWLQQQEATLQNAAVCRGDDVPAPLPVDLTEYLPFLRLP